MGATGGPNTVDDGLVLCLDAANKQSFKGEPTTNVVTNTNLDTGWSKNYQASIIFDEIDPPDGINSPVVGFNQDNTSQGYWYSYGDYAPQVPNTTYTVSLYVKTRDSNFVIRAFTASNSETGRVWTKRITVPNDDQWHRVVWDSFLNPADSTSDSLSFNFYFDSDIADDPNSRTWFCAPQMEAKPYATPFVDGTRGSTVATGGGLVDLVGNNHGELNGDVKGLSQSLLLSGNGGVQLPHNSSWVLSDTDSFSICIWVYPTSNPSLAMVFSHQKCNLPTIQISLTDTTVNARVNPTLTHNESIINSWNFLVLTYNNKSFKLYLNSELILSGSTLGWTDYSEGYSEVWLGKRYPCATTNDFAGEIGSFYYYKNKELTAAEVKQNYNATKGRYGL